MWTSLISHSFHYGTAVCVSVLMCHPFTVSLELYMYVYMFKACVSH